MGAQLRFHTATAPGGGPVHNGKNNAHEKHEEGNAQLHDNFHNGDKGEPLIHQMAKQHQGHHRQNQSEEGQRVEKGFDPVNQKISGPPGTIYGLNSGVDRRRSPGSCPQNRDSRQGQQGYIRHILQIFQQGSQYRHQVFRDSIAGENIPCIRRQKKTENRDY